MLLDFARSFTHAANAHLAEPALKRQILGDAKATLNLHRSVDNFEAVLARDQFGDGGFSAEWLAPVGGHAHRRTGDIMHLPRFK